jgi:hypothetical protein
MLQVFGALFAPDSVHQRETMRGAIMKPSPTHTRRALKCMAVGTLAAAFIVPTASATPPSTGSGEAPLVSNIMKTKHDTIKNSISNVR